jgi:hypothetical protein
MNIETGKELYCENLITLRVKGTQLEVNTSVMALNQFVKDCTLMQAGPTISTTFSVEQSGNDIVLDMEVMIPVRNINIFSEKYKIKPTFRLVNAAYTRFEGRPEKMQDACNEMMAYLKAKSLQNITSLYTVMIKEPKIVNGIPGDMTIDLYIGINPSIL